MDISWGGFAGSALAICVFLGPFVYKGRRSKGGSHFRATLDVMLVFMILFLLIAGGSIALYGLGIVIDKPAQQLGSGGYEPAETHSEIVRVKYLLLGVGLIAAGWVIGKISELRE
jgi:hypothetical protein